MTNPLEEIPLETAQQIDELCDRFEEGWSADQQFQIEQFLREVRPEVQPALLAALLPIELELMERVGQQPDMESYGSRFPQFADAIAAVVADANEEGQSNTYQTGGAETFISSPGTDDFPPDQAEASTPTMMRGNADSQTSITPVGTGQKSASIIEGKFGRYQIKKTLGQGAMGAVYLAHDTQLDRQVALKIPKFTDDPNGEMLERFYREARSAAMLRSPNICPVFDVGEIDGQHYITMAFIRGRTLKDFTKSKKRHAEKQIAVTIRKLAVGLGEAHAHGVIHRDLKPANIMIDGKAEPVVMDFGLARRNAGSEVEVTQTGAILGTPAYMSPEQVDGEQSEIGPQSDVYSLGVIMYELITGQMPFQGTLMAILKQIAVDEPQPPSELRDDLDPVIETICLKMMAKDLRARYQSMEEVARDLAAYLKKPRTKKDADTPKSAVDAPNSDLVAGGEESNPVLKTAPPKAKQLAKPAAVKKQRKSSTRSQANRRDRFNIARYHKVLIGVAALAACGLLYGAITLFLRVGEVDVKVVIDDPSISVHFEEGGVVRFEGSGKPIKLKPGKRKFVIERDGIKAVTDEFTVNKDDKNVLHVTLIDGKLVVLKDGAKPDTLASGGRQSADKPATRSTATPPRRAVAPFDSAHAKAHQEAWADYLGEPLEKEVALPDGAKMTFMLIPPGEFMMGATVAEQKLFLEQAQAADDDFVKHDLTVAKKNSRHRVRITQPFYLGKYEVTQAQWQAVIEGNPSRTKLPTNPVERVPLNDVSLFLDELNENPTLAGTRFALPTEAQWEYACRAGAATSWCFGDNETKLQEFCWFRANAGKDTHRGGQLRPNPFGLHDMYGNMIELCADWYDPDYYSNSPVNDPAGPPTGERRVVRGGSWQHPARNCNSTYRRFRRRDENNPDQGIRLVLTIDAAKLKTAQTPPTDTDRAVAEWVFSRGGSVAIGEDVARLKSGDQLPDGAWRLKRIVLNELKITGVDLTRISQLSDLQILALNGTRIDDEGMQYLAELKSLQHLYLSNTLVTDVGVRQLSQLTELQSLYLSGTKVTDQGIRSLSQLKQLSIVWVTDTDVTNDSLKVIGQLPEIKSLAFRNTKITSDGIRYLNSLAKLRILYLDNNEIDDTAIPWLRRMKSLKNLSVQKTGLSEVGLKQLKEALPNCEIAHD